MIVLNQLEQPSWTQNQLSTQLTDDCGYCFKSCSDPQGILVCITCLQVYCDIHAHLHELKNQHMLWVRIHRTSKDSATQDKTKKTKLMLGTEYLVQSELVTLKYPDISTLDIPSWAISSKDSIHQAFTLPLKSYTIPFGDENSQLNICPHLNNPDTQLSSKHDLSICSMCSLSTPLWMCLECGQVHCGRKQLDESGGNGHALVHFQESGHFPVVQLGTITFESSSKIEADVYCYLCDDMVQDPYLATRLLEYHHMNPSNMKKTTLSISELEMIKNQSADIFTFKTEDLEEQESSNYTGMINMGNSCYISSVMQCMFNAIRDKLHISNLELHFSTCEKIPWNCFTCQVNKLFLALSEPNDLIRPTSFKKMINGKGREFSNNLQQDVFDFWQFFMKLAKSNRYSIITDYIHPFPLFQSLKCSECNHVQYNPPVNTDALSVSLTSKDPTTLQDCIKMSFIHPETVTFTCEQCKKKQDGTKQYHHLMNENNADSILIQLARYKYDDKWNPVKISSKIMFDLDNTILFSDEWKLPEDVKKTIKNDKDVGIPDELLSIACSMGFTKDQCELAYKRLNTNVTADSLINYLLENANDLIETQIDPVNIGLVMSMGFEENQARTALIQTDNDPERAIDYLLSHSKQSDALIHHKSNKWYLDSFVVHKGSSVHCGHYIACIRTGESFVMLNDDKVLNIKNPEELAQESYLLFFKRSNQ